jgi:quercetin dioxygenase-like cupin family protein
MPVIKTADDHQVLDRGVGWVITALADRDTISQEALGARRWSIASGVIGPETVHGDFDEMLYVISGSGEAIVGEARFRLEPESVLWLETGDRYHLEAGSEGLEILQGYAPG